MTEQREALKGFEARLLHALTEVDATRPAAEAPFSPGSARRGRRARTTLAIVAAMVAALGGTAAAAASGMFGSAPPNVQRIFAGLHDHGRSVDANHAVRIGVIDDHVAYAAPTADGGFCLYFGPNPRRSGPTGSSCIQRGAASGEVVFSVVEGTDGGLLFGRAGTTSAQKVTATFPRSGETVEAPVADRGFFAVQIPDWSMRSLLIEIPPDPEHGVVPKNGEPILSFQCDRVPEISVTAVDGQGGAVAHGVAVPAPECATGPTHGPVH